MSRPAPAMGIAMAGIEDKTEQPKNREGVPSQRRTKKSRPHPSSRFYETGQTAAGLAPASGNKAAEQAMRAKSQRPAAGRSAGGKSGQANPTLFKPLVNAALFSLALAILMFLLALPAEADRKTEAVNFSGTGRQLGFSLKTGEADRLKPIGAERLIKLGSDRFEVLNVSGGTEYSVAADLKDPVVLSKGDQALVYDREGLYYCLLGRSGLVYEGRTEWPLQGAVWGERGYLALLESAPHSRGSLLVLDPEGKRILQWTSRRSADSGYLINAAFGPGDRTINLSLLNADDTSVRPVVKRLALGESNAGEELLNLQPDLTRPFFLLTTTREGRLWLCDGKSIYVYDERAAELRVLYQFDRVSSMSAYGQGVAAVAASDGQNLGLFCLTGEASDQNAKLELGSVVGPPKVAGQYLSIVSDSSVLRLAAGDLSRPHRLDLSTAPVDQSVDRGGSILAVTADFVLRSER